MPLDHVIAQCDDLRAEISVAIEKLAAGMNKFAQDLEYQDFAADALIKAGEQLKRVNDMRRMAIRL